MIRFRILAIANVQGFARVNRAAAELGASLRPTNDAIAKAKARELMIDMDDIIGAAEENIGFCLSCGADQYGCEPDTERRKCENCGDLQVYGAEQIVVMGRAE